MYKRRSLRQKSRAAKATKNPTGAPLSALFSAYSWLQHSYFPFLWWNEQKFYRGVIVLDALAGPSHRWINIEKQHCLIIQPRSIRAEKQKSGGISVPSILGRQRKEERRQKCDVINVNELSITEQLSLSSRTSTDSSSMELSRQHPVCSPFFPQHLNQREKERKNYSIIGHCSRKNIVVKTRQWKILLLLLLLYLTDAQGRRNDVRHTQEGSLLFSLLFQGHASEHIFSLTNHGSSRLRRRLYLVLNRGCLSQGALFTSHNVSERSLHKKDILLPPHCFGSQRSQRWRRLFFALHSSDDVSQKIKKNKVGDLRAWCQTLPDPVSGQGTALTENFWSQAYEVTPESHTFWSED